MTKQRGVLVWQFVDGTERDATGTNDGLRVNDIGNVEGGSLFICATAAASSSTWTELTASSINALDWKESVRVATTVDGPIATAYENADTVDGVVLATGDRILLKNQSTASENGIYTVNASGAPTRALDADESAEVSSGLTTYVEEGTANAKTIWILVTVDPITVGATSLTFNNLSAVSTPLNNVLVAGNTTGGTNITISTGDAIVSGVSDPISLTPGAGGNVEANGPVQVTGDVFPNVTGTLNVGSTTNHFAASNIDKMYAGGGVVADAVTGAADAVIGKIEAADHGVTIVSGTANTGNIVFTDTTGDVIRGRVRYAHGSDLFFFAVGGADAYGMSGTALYSPSAKDLGLTGSRWANGYINTLYAAGAASGNGATDASALVIGDGTGNTGATLYCSDVGVARWGTVDVTGAGGAIRGGMQYNHSTDTFIGIAGGTAVTSTLSTGLYPFSTGTKGLGSASLRWASSFINTLYVAGASSGDAPAGADELIIGDASADVGLTIYQGAFIGRLNFAETLAGNEGQIRYDGVDFVFRANGTDAFEMDGAEFKPLIAGIDLGGDAAANRWDNAWVNTLYVAGASSGDAAAEADDLVIGDGTATVRGVTLFSTGDSYYAFSDTLLGNVGGFLYQHSTDSLISRVGGQARARMTTAAWEPQTTGAQHLGSTTKRWGDGFVNVLYVAGGSSGDAAAGSADAVFGGGAADVGMTFNVGAANIGRISWNNATNQEHLQIEGSGNQFIFRVNNVDSFTFQSGVFRPLAASVDLGNATQAWDNIHGETLLVKGAAKADGAASADDLVIGTTADAAVGVTILTSTAGVGRLAFQDVGAGASTRGGLQYQHTSGVLQFIREAVVVAEVSASTLRPGTDGTQYLGDVTKGWASLAMAERADHVHTPTAAFGEVWVKSDAPNTLYFTDDGGDDHPLSLMPTIDLMPDNAHLPGTGNAVKGEDPTSFVPYLRHGDATTTTAYWNATMPRQYTGNGVTVRVVWSGDAGVGGNVRMSAAVERHNAGYDVNASSFGTATTSDEAGSATIGLIVISDLAISAANMDGIVAGDSFRLRIQREGGHANDTFAGNFDVHHIQIIENP